jgi:hypothetical protein
VLLKVFLEQGTHRLKPLPRLLYVLALVKVLFDFTDRELGGVGDVLDV